MTSNLLTGNEIHIRDAIHGFVSLNELETRVLQTRAFQRLRFIHQLGTSHFVYPGAVHTRFEHSLGVLHLASRVVRLLPREVLDEFDELVFRLASLLHDVGHPPFSHVGEEAGLFEQGIDHEHMSVKIIRESPIGEIVLQALGKDAIDRIAYIITGKTDPRKTIDQLLYELLAGQAGIDRMDYLLRDSHCLGVSYGRFDLERVLETICYDHEEGLFWEDGGVHALEQFVLARYFMFKEVYFHNTRRTLDFHLGQMTRAFIEDTRGRSTFPTDTEQYVSLIDPQIEAYMYATNRFSDIFLGRGFFRTVEWESDDHPTTEEIEGWETIEHDLSEAYASDKYHFDKAENAPYKAGDPSQIRVLHRGKIDCLPEASSLVESLRKIRKRRVYADGDIFAQVSEMVKARLLGAKQ